MSLAFLLLKDKSNSIVTSSVTFNAPGNFIPPYGKTIFQITARGTPGNASFYYNTPVAAFNPTLANYNYEYVPAIPGNVTAYYPASGGTYNPFYPADGGYLNPIIVGNPTGYNPPTPGNYVSTNPPTQGNYVSTNPPTQGNYVSTNPSTQGNYVSTNPPTQGNYTGSNPPYYDPAGLIYRIHLDVYGVTNPGYYGGTTFPGFTEYASYNDQGAHPYSQGLPTSRYAATTNYYGIPGQSFTVSWQFFYEFFSYQWVQGNINYNPPVPGNPNYNYFPGTDNYNPATPGNPNYNYFPGTDNYNPATPGTANYNPWTPTTTNPYYPASGGTLNPYYPAYSNSNPNTPAFYTSNANYNSFVAAFTYTTTVPGNAASSTNVLGVSLPGGAADSAAPVIGPTTISIDYTNAGTPISVPPGGYVTINYKPKTAP
jgi:hypothetical protein